MPGFLRLALVAIGLMVCATARPASANDDLYSARTIVTGQGEQNRQIGFKACLDAVLVRVSGDQRLPKKPEMAALRDKAGSFVAEFRYRDRMEGIPIHDEQGTHDRPHDLSCLYRPQVIDPMLTSLGSRPWLAERPQLAIFLATERGARHFALTADDERGAPMRESFVNAADPLAMRIAFPEASHLSESGLDDKALHETDMAALDKAAKQVGADQALAGSIVWSDKELGWIADWRLATGGKTYHWQVRGVSFDEAFRVAMRGAVQVLSGNGQPD
ncbi:MAG: DUF2066 domain-containing protein [Mesorhizobium sp.]|uniref:DUF2066 domain-containing protein n=1 Tax=unclassified Mesorhizobium TaxID=325217 RepID=UPI000FD5121C|nr:MULTISPECIES: DUF2066 domain-containing protein [unclassified Mesorhizobium]RUU99642.1 DUF2066 domain-containing protein [Mesorhizobium sp. M6A.T.Cr.TU.017.01.1.1]RWQ32664.1 MAG: DUF2066 domain-containing protein [Mesorhizobium sp.]RWQ42036.1 MAG: DUF2066 domain-containing protein [Mesorhizobium sp.]RWQ65332.1 MAG: DUF2066 domain-containing protein [Mesorhizobium sp.]TIL24648.1 MAG: DUF2066 domain-containing protein [Mesorhizobium sp.]